MNTLPLSLLAHLAGDELQGEDVVVDTLTRDTRQLLPGGLYVALRGENFDGHQFARDAALRGAAALLVEHAVAVDLPQVIVNDTQLALARIAASLQRDRGTVVAITGSNGKTSVGTGPRHPAACRQHLSESRQSQQRDRPAAGGD